MLELISKAKEKIKKLEHPIYTYKMFDIGGIPTVITEDHHEVLPFWYTSKLKDATLLHIDAHDDMWDGPYAPTFDEYTGQPFVIPKHVVDYTKRIGIANFICPAIYLGTVSSVYWLNPLQYPKKQLLDFGTTRTTQKNKTGRRDLSTHIVMANGISNVYFDEPFWDMNFNLIVTQNIDPDEMLIPITKPFIVDIDLDAFCCGPRPYNVPENVQRIDGYEKRIEQSCDLLSKIQYPDLITITRSQRTGCDDMNKIPFVPRDRVDGVQKVLLANLKQIYG